MSRDAKQDPVVYGAELGVVFLAEGPRTASIQEGLDCGLYHSNLEGERYFRYLKNKIKHPGGKSPRENLPKSTRKRSDLISVQQNVSVQYNGGSPTLYC